MKMGIKTAVAILALSFSATMYAATSEAELIAVCKAAKDNDVQELKRKVKDTGQKLRKLYPVLECNALPLVAFAMKYGAEDTATYIISRTKTRDLKKSAGEVVLQEWFLSNGKSDSEVYNKLLKKVSG